MKRPNFMIVGASKCGTTALSAYLNDHPQVFMTHPKEPNYFADYSYPNFRYVDTLEDYLGLYEDARENHLAVGEASASYLYTREAIPRIRDFDPDMRIIVMLRNPVDMLNSYHGQLLYSYEESEKDFEEAWRLQDERRAGKNLPPSCREVPALYYRDVGMYAEQVERVYECFPDDQVYVIVFDDMVADTRATYEDTLAFLGLASDGRTEFPRINEAKSFPDTPLSRLVAQPPKRLVLAGRAAKRMLGIKNLRILRTLRRMANKPSPRPPVTAEFRAELQEIFAKDIRKLESILRRDLSAWLKK